MRGTDGWRLTDATVYTCGDWEDGSRWKLWGEGSISGHLIVFSYQVNGETYSGEFMGPAMKEGETFPVRYNPDDPAQNAISMNSTRDKVISTASAIAGILLAGAIIWARERYWKS